MAGLHRLLRRRPERRSSASGQKRREICAALWGLLQPVPEITDFVGHLGRDLAVEIDVLIETAHRHHQRIARLVIVAHFQTLVDEQAILALFRKQHVFFKRLLQWVGSSCQNPSLLLPYF